jgi:hypothetical protein
VGDIVCQFQGSDILTVAEISGNTWWGSDLTTVQMRRAVNFLASPPDMAVYICGKSMSFDRAKSYCLQFAASRDFIRELCWTSKTPNGEHNIPAQDEIERIGGLTSPEKGILTGLWRRVIHLFANNRLVQ